MTIFCPIEHIPLHHTRMTKTPMCTLWRSAPAGIRHFTASVRHHPIISSMRTQHAALFLSSIRAINQKEGDLK